MAYTSQPANQVIGGLTVTITRPTNKAGTNTADDSGALVDGAKFAPSYTTYSPDIEQELFPTKYVYTGKAFKLSFTYGEPTLPNLQNAWDISNAIVGAGPKTLAFGTATSGDFLPAPLVIAVTGYSPGAATATSLRTITLNKAFLDTPGEMTITKKGITTMPATFNGAFDSVTSRVGNFSDIIT